MANSSDASTDYIDVLEQAIRHEDKRQYVAAKKLYEQVYHMRGVLDDAEDICILEGLAFCAFHTNDYPAAVARYRQVLEFRKKFLNRDKDEGGTVVARGNFAHALMKTGEYGEARHMLMKNQIWQEKHLTYDDETLLETQHDLALAYSDDARYLKAALIDCKVLRVRTTKLPEDHVDICTSRYNLARNWYYSEQLEAASKTIAPNLAIVTKGASKPLRTIVSDSKSLAQACKQKLELKRRRKAAFEAKAKAKANARADTKAEKRPQKPGSSVTISTLDAPQRSVSDKNQATNVSSIRDSIKHCSSSTEDQQSKQDECLSTPPSLTPVPPSSSISKNVAPLSASSSRKSGNVSIDNTAPPLPASPLDTDTATVLKTEPNPTDRLLKVETVISNTSNTSAKLISNSRSGMILHNT
ncbi:hypothetical protein MBLNU459_g1135t1 [Dothideomycetes sp. NU459]